MEYNEIAKKDRKAYDALERRITDIFNGAIGKGLTADEWINNEFLGVKQVGNVMSAVEQTFEEQLKEKVFSTFVFKPFQAEHFEQPREAALWLWALHIRA